MKLSEFASFDALGLAALVLKKEVSPVELAQTAATAIEAINEHVNAVIETYPDRIEMLDETSLCNGPFRGVPFLIKDVVGHEKGRKIEFGSRLCKGMLGEQDTHYAELVRAAGINIIGRSNTPEYSISGTTENALYGNTSTPWKKGYSAGGSSGGSMAAVVAGMVPISHGSDGGGSIRIPASWCGGVGLKPSRGRISMGPMFDEDDFGMAMNFVVTKTVRDAASMLDCLAVPQTGDPFLIPKPQEPYAKLATKKSRKLKIGWSVNPLLGVAVDPQIASAVKITAACLESMGHDVVEASPSFSGDQTMRSLVDIWFFNFYERLNRYSNRSGHHASADTLEPVIYMLYEYSRGIKSEDLKRALDSINAARRQLGEFFKMLDVWLSPTTARVSEPWGNYTLGRTDVVLDTLVEKIWSVPCQFTIPHNIMGIPAISLPLAMHSSGLPIGIQLGAKPAQEHVLLQVAAALEEAMPWSNRIPPLHVSRLAR